MLLKKQLLTQSLAKNSQPKNEGVLYKLWEKTQPKTMNGDTGEMEYVDFDLFYKRQMNKIIDHFKTKLD